MNIPRKILLGAVASERIPNAYLFVGANSQALLDEALFLAGELKSKSPDLAVISSSGKAIKIDEIRQISSFARFGPAECKWKVVIVQGADLMTEEASNSFLKTLEEPHDRILFILTTTRYSRILKTIASRCQQIMFAGEETDSYENTEEYADKILNIGKIDIPQLLSLAEELAQQPDPLAALNSILGSYRKKLDASSGKKFLAIKMILEAARSIERRGNKRLTMDNMLLSLKEAT